MFRGQTTYSQGDLPLAKKRVWLNIWWLFSLSCAIYSDFAMAPPPPPAITSSKKSGCLNFLLPHNRNPPWKGNHGRNGTAISCNIRNEAGTTTEENFSHIYPCHPRRHPIWCSRGKSVTWNCAAIGTTMSNRWSVSRTILNKTQTVDTCGARSCQVLDDDFQLIKSLIASDAFFRHLFAKTEFRKTLINPQATSDPFNKSIKAALLLLTHFTTMYGLSWLNRVSKHPVSRW